MTLRRKLSPAPLPAPDPTAAPRKLAPSRACTFALPTVAALLMMGGVACSARASADGDVQADLPTRHAIASSTSSPTNATTTAPTTGGTSMVVPIDPEPQLVKGESAIVVPTPPKGPPKTPTPPVAPTHLPPHMAGGLSVSNPSI
jgi:hypothetical protein